jgi:hypothetical protein
MLGDDNDAGYDPGYYGMLNPCFDLVCNIVLVAACANEPKSAKHLQRPIDVVVRAFFPEKANDTKVDVVVLLNSLVSEGKLERVWNARLEGDERTADNVLYAIPSPKPSTKRKAR